MGGILSLLALCYGFLVHLRIALYAVGIFKKRKLPQWVISVGNITLGGTGKTPAVIHIAGLLRSHNRYPAVVSRGYRRRNESEIVIVSDGTVLSADASRGGDEPGLIGARLPGVPVVVGRDRYRAARLAVQVFGADTIVLDDGFQHVRLRRDLNIVLLDAGDPFGNGKLFPAGILREPLAVLRRAHVVLITRVDSAMMSIEDMKAAIRRHSEAPIFTSRHEPTALVETKTGETLPLSTLRNTAALGFSGIARPATFTALLRSLGAEIKAEMVYPDHYFYSKRDLAEIFQKAVDVGAAMIITTEKDAARLKVLQPDGIWALRIELKVNQEHDWEKVILEAIEHSKDHRV